MIYSSSIFLILRILLWAVDLPISPASKQNVLSILYSIDVVADMLIYFPKVVGGWSGRYISSRVLRNEAKVVNNEFRHSSNSVDHPSSGRSSTAATPPMGRSGMTFQEAKSNYASGAAKSDGPSIASKFEEEKVEEVLKELDDQTMRQSNSSPGKAYTAFLEFLDMPQ